MTAPTLTPASRAYLRDPDRLAALADYGLVGDGAPSAHDHAETLEHLTALTRLAAQLCGVVGAVVNVHDADHQHQLAATGITPALCSVEESLCAPLLVGRAPLTVADASLDPRFRGHPAVDGRLARIRLYATTPITTAAGHVIGTLCIVDLQPRELTEGQREGLVLLADQVIEVLELRRRTRQLHTTLTELHRSNALLSEFAGRVSHDLKTPLTAIQGFSELLLTSTPVGADPQASRFADSINGSSRRMHVLIDDLLSYASLGGDVTRTRVDVNGLVDQVVSDLGPGRAPAVRVRADRSVHGDPVQLRALLQNLLTNAAAYAPGSPVEVVAEAATPTGWTLRVVDHGPGVPAADRERVLMPLVRLHGSDDVPGTGLGLATCQRIAAAHGGTLTLSGTPGGGTTVTLHVP